MLRVIEWDIERVWECESERVIFEHRHENKSCTSMLRVSEWEIESCESSENSESSESERVWEWLLSIDMKTKVVQHVESEWMRDCKSVRVRKSESEKVWEWLLSIDMKTKVVQQTFCNFWLTLVKVRKTLVNDRKR